MHATTYPRHSHKKTIAILLIGCAQAHAQDNFSASPFFDIRYGGAANGIVYTDFGFPSSTQSDTSSITVLPDGRVWLTGHESETNTGHVLFAAFNRDGTPDSTFGPAHDGLLALGQNDIVISGVTAANNGALLFAGTSGTIGSAGVIGRLTAQGIVDTTFNGSGQRLFGANVFISAAASDAQLHAVAVQPDGRIVVAGIAATSVNSALSVCMGVARLTSDGAFDVSFAGGGHGCIAPNGASAPIAWANDIAIQPDGRILVAGFAYHLNGTGQDFAVARLTSQGELDTTFGADHDGWSYVGFDVGGSGWDQATQIALDEQGRILLGGQVEISASGGQNSVGGVARLQPNGLIDPAFGSQGKTQIDHMDGVQCLHVARKTAASSIVDNGRIFVSGYSQDDGSTKAVLLNSDGHIEQNFAQNGATLAPPPSSLVSDGLAIVSEDWIYWPGSPLIGSVTESGQLVLSRSIVPIFRNSFD
jgi:uncharacterized delta-60 repeat protein